MNILTNYLQFSEDYAEIAGYLTLEDIFTLDAIYLTAQRCAIGFKKRKDTQAFLFDPWGSSLKIQRAVLDGAYKPKYYKTVKLMERGKIREIKPPVFESKVIQKLLCDYIIRPVLEREIIDTSYASVVGRGTAAMQRDITNAINAHMKASEDGFVIITDFRGYFASIDLVVLRKMLEERISDRRIVDLCMKFSPGERGLSLGNELSQIPASFYPTAIDKTVIASGLTQGYFRYMDDTLMIVRSRKDISRVLEIQKREADALHLTIKPPKVIRLGKNFDFCKVRYRYDRKHNQYFTLPNKTTAKREKRKLYYFQEQIKEGSMTEKEAEMQYKSFVGAFTSQPNTAGAAARIREVYSRTVENVSQTAQAMQR